MTQQKEINEGLGRGREDDEYHVPDPVDNRQKHTIKMKLSKDGGPVQHKQMDVKTLHGAEHAKKFAHDQARKQGWTVHEETVSEESVELDEVRKANTASARAGLAARGRKEPNEAEQAKKNKESDDAWSRLMAHAAAMKKAKSVEEGYSGAFEKSEENKRSAEAAKKQGDMFAHHLHMADHHDNLALWHFEKGRHSVSNKHAEKAEEHQELAVKHKTGVKEEVACNNVGSGNIAGTQGDAGKKNVMTKEPLKRKKLISFKEACDCWANYKRKPGTKPCEKGSCVKEDTELEEGGLWANIHAKRKRIKNGSGERMRKPGSKGAPTDADFKAANESIEIDEAAVDGKGHKSSTGGLTQKGRDYYNNKTGGNLQAPVTTPPSKLKPGSKAANRRKSFCARMSGVDGPMKDEKGRPTRKALALRKWNC